MHPVRILRRSDPVAVGLNSRFFGGFGLAWKRNVSKVQRHKDVFALF
jgi:hypothetical protein